MAKRLPALRAAPGDAATPCSWMLARNSNSPAGRMASWKPTRHSGGGSNSCSSKIPSGKIFTPFKSSATGLSRQSYPARQTRAGVANTLVSEFAPTGFQESDRQRRSRNAAQIATEPVRRASSVFGLTNDEPDDDTNDGQQPQPNTDKNNNHRLQISGGYDCGGRAGGRRVIPITQSPLLPLTKIILVPPNSAFPAAVDFF